MQKGDEMTMIFVRTHLITTQFLMCAYHGFKNIPLWTMMTNVYVDLPKLTFYLYKYVYKMSMNE